MVFSIRGQGLDNGSCRVITAVRQGREMQLMASSPMAGLGSGRLENLVHDRIESIMAPGRLKILVDCSSKLIGKPGQRQLQVD